MLTVADMKTITFLLLTTLTFAAGCSSSERGSGTGGEGGGSAGSGGEGGGSTACVNEPMDCIQGVFYTDENGCRACDYFECPPALCPEGSSQTCVGDGEVSCVGAEGGCGDIDTNDPALPACPGTYACVDAAWTCACPTTLPAEGETCADLGQTCDVPSDLDCGPATITIECTESGWTRQEVDGGAGGGADCG